MQEISETLKQHRRETWRKIYLPVLIPTGLLILGMVVLFALTITDTLTAQQIRVAGGCLFTLFILFPLVLIFLLFDAIFVFMALGSDALHQWVIKPLEMARLYAQKGAALTQQTAEQIAEPVIEARTQFAKWRYQIIAPLMNPFFDHPDDEGPKPT